MEQSVLQQPQFLPHARLGDLFIHLTDMGYEVVAQQLSQGALAYQPLQSVADLPRGIETEQVPGRFSITSASHSRYFAWATGPQGIKPWVFAAHEPLWRARRTESGFAVEPVLPQVSKRAIFGVRSCDLAALRLQDQHFMGDVSDPYYAARRDEVLLVAVNCTHPASTCFCASTGDGPAATSGFDVQLTELDDGFLVAAGSAVGRQLLDRLDLSLAETEQIQEAGAALAVAASGQKRSMPAHAHFAGKQEHSLWQQMAETCLGCGNCTQVCPTCFCHAEMDETELSGETATHVRVWDSCFADGHAWLHGFQVRPELGQRYRQWFMHKLLYWHEQYGRSGCVGCGRCIVWCPVGIDLPAVAGQLAAT